MPLTSANSGFVKIDESIIVKEWILQVTCSKKKTKYNGTSEEKKEFWGPSVMNSIGGNLYESLVVQWMADQNIWKL